MQVKRILLITHVELRRTNLFLMNDVIEEEKRNLAGSLPSLS